MSEPSHSSPPAFHAIAQPPGPGRHSHLRGIALLIGAVSFFALLDTTSKWLSHQYPVPMIVWVRYVTQTLLMIVLLAPKLGWGLVRTRAWGQQFTRAFVLLCISLAFLVALSKLPIAEGTAISFLSPLILTVLSVIVLREHVRPGAW